MQTGRPPVDDLIQVVHQADRVLAGVRHHLELVQVEEAVEVDGGGEVLDGVESTGVHGVAQKKLMQKKDDVKVPHLHQTHMYIFTRLKQAIMTRSEKKTNTFLVFFLRCPHCDAGTSSSVARR